MKLPWHTSCPVPLLYRLLVEVCLNKGLATALPAPLAMRGALGLATALPAPLAMRGARGLAMALPALLAKQGARGLAMALIGFRVFTTGYAWRLRNPMGFPDERERERERRLRSTKETWIRPRMGGRLGALR